MTPKECKDWLVKTAEMAKEAGHVFPEMAACEGALESAYGKSTLVVQANNLFGRKQSAKPVYDTLVMPTREFIDGEWVIDGNAAWVKYPSLKESFEDRMALLKRLAPKYPHYKAALAATDAVTFVTEVSKTWSTDPKRGDKVISIFKNNFPDLYAACLAKPEEVKEP